MYSTYSVLLPHNMLIESNNRGKLIPIRSTMKWPIVFSIYSSECFTRAHRREHYSRRRAHNNLYSNRFDCRRRAARWIYVIVTWLTIRLTPVALCVADAYLHASTTPTGPCNICKGRGLHTPTTWSQVIVNTLTVVVFNAWTKNDRTNYAKIDYDLVYFRRGSCIS